MNFLLLILMLTFISCGKDNDQDVSDVYVPPTPTYFFNPGSCVVVARGYLIGRCGFTVHHNTSDMYLVQSRYLNNWIYSVDLRPCMFNESCF